MAHRGKAVETCKFCTAEVRAALWRPVDDRAARQGSGTCVKCVQCQELTYCVSCMQSSKGPMFYKTDRGEIKAAAMPIAAVVTAAQYKCAKCGQNPKQLPIENRPDWQGTDNRYNARPLRCGMSAARRRSQSCSAQMSPSRKTEQRALLSPTNADWIAGLRAAPPLPPLCARLRGWDGRVTRCRDKQRTEPEVEGLVYERLLDSNKFNSTHKFRFNELGDGMGACAPVCAAGDAQQGWRGTATTIPSRYCMRARHRSSARTTRPTLSRRSLHAAPARAVSA